MPKKLNLTANNLKQRPGWFPPIDDVESKANVFHGDSKTYRDPENMQYFHKILKENLGFDLEADPEDVKKRIIITSKTGQFAMDAYLKSMDEIRLKPDSPEKIEEVYVAAGDMERALYHLLSKGRLVFIPLGETEPRQLRYNPGVGEFQLSGPLKNLQDYQALDESMLPKDKKGNIIYQKKEELLKPEHPGEFKEKMPEKPKPVGPFTEKLRPAPVLGEVPPLREEPKPPKNPLEGYKSEEELLEAHYKEITKDLVKPEYRVVDMPIPRMVISEPVKVEKPNPPRENMKAPEVPQVEQDIAKVEAQIRALEAPNLPPGVKRIFQVRPVPVAEPFKPVLENPDPPEPPEYLELPKDEPVFKYPLRPKLEILLPKWTPGEEPKLPDFPELLDEPVKPVLRQEPAEPQRPGFFRRLFSSSAVARYEERHNEWEIDHNNWIQERDAMVQNEANYRVELNSVRRQNNERIQNYEESVKTYVTALHTYLTNVEKYQQEVQELEAENTVLYEEFRANKDAYDKAVFEMGEQYNVEYEKFLKEHADWEKRVENIIQENQKIKEKYESTPEYKEYTEKLNWYKTYMSPYALDYKQSEEKKVQYTEEYNKNLETYNKYLEEEKAYQKSLDPIKKFIEADDKEQNGNNPDYEENKEARLNERFLANEKANAEYDKVLKEYLNKLEALNELREDLVNKEEHIQYVKAKEEYDRNEELKNKKIVVKKQLPNQFDIDINAKYEDLSYEDKLKLDEVILSGDQRLPSQNVPGEDLEENEILESENNMLNTTVVEDEIEDLLKDAMDQEENKEEEKELKPDEEEITLYEYELRRYEAYENDRKYYDLLKNRYDEKMAEYEEKKQEVDNWNEDLENKVKQYDEQIKAYRITAQNNISQRLTTYESRQRQYNEDHRKWRQEASDYKQMKDSKVTEFVTDSHKWRQEKAEFDKKKAAYDEKVKEYEYDVIRYNRAVDDYNTEYKNYVDKLAKYENDVKMNEVIEKRNQQYEEEYNKIAKTYADKQLKKSPELRDYEFNKLEYMNGAFRWGMELQKDKTVPEWKNNMKSEQVMNKYFDDHQRKINQYNSYKIKCKNIKEVDPIQKQNYETMMEDQRKYGKYPEQSRVFFKMIDLEDTKLDNVVDSQEKVDFEFFKKAATVKMYNRVVRNEMEKTVGDIDFDPRGAVQFLDNKYRKDVLDSMRRDDALTKSLKKMYDEDVKMSKSIKRDVHEHLRSVLKDGSKMAYLYEDRYENTKTKVVDPIKNQTHEPAVQPKKGMFPGK